MTIYKIQRSYIILTLLNTLSTSVIWGVNTLFLLDAGLSNFEAFMVNGFFTAGMMLFEIPTGVVADTLGRKMSYLMGAITVMVSTIFYYILWNGGGAFYFWILASLIMGLGFTFFSGAIEAWVVDALNHFDFDGKLDDVFAKGQIAKGVAMLSGASLGGWLSQKAGLGLPYLVRSGLLLVSFLFAYLTMKDWGFVTQELTNVRSRIRNILLDSIELGFKEKKMRWMILTSPFIMGTSFFAFYAAQPYLLELYGDSSAYWIAGLAASLVAGSQVIGGLTVEWFRTHFKRRTSLLIIVTILSSLALMAAGFSKEFYLFVGVLTLWALLGSIARPVKQSYLNHCIPSSRRATLLSFDGLMGSAGGFLLLPLLGAVADRYGYGLSLVVAGILQAGAMGFLFLARREKALADFF